MSIYMLELGFLGLFLKDFGRSQGSRDWLPSKNDVLRAQKLCS